MVAREHGLPIFSIILDNCGWGGDPAEVRGAIQRCLAEVKGACGYVGVSDRTGPKRGLIGIAGGRRNDARRTATPGSLAGKVHRSANFPPLAARCPSSGAGVHQ